MPYGILLYPRSYLHDIATKARRKDTGRIRALRGGLVVQRGYHTSSPARVRVYRVPQCPCYVYRYMAKRHNPGVPKVRLDPKWPLYEPLLIP